MVASNTQFRRLHRALAPLMVIPLLLTLITGCLYQFVDLAGEGDTFAWMLALHKGHFGAFNLEFVYPFLNALGLLTLLVTGTTLWLQSRHRRRKRSDEIGH